MKRSRSIPRELIEDKAHKIWQKRALEGREGTAEGDWNEAKEYLEKHYPRVIFWWKVNTPVRSLRNFWSLFRDVNSRDFALEIVKTLGIGLTALGLLFSLWEGLEDRRLTQERLVTERFSKAVEQLGQDKDITVRIGGIYALERIAKDYDEDHWTIMEVLSSYVRKNSSLPPELRQIPQNQQEREQRQKELEKLSGVSIDVQAVLTVIRRREDPDRDREERIDLSFTNLKEANLFGANLGGANLFGANLGGAVLDGANLGGADLDGANLGGADLFGANLGGAVLDGANLRQAVLSGANLRGADLEGADLLGANLGGAVLDGAVLDGADLFGADLEGADLFGADLRGADLRLANLIDADLDGADLNGADLNGADLRLANLDNAWLIEAQNLTRTQIKSACNWSKAIYKLDESENLKYIEELKQDKASDRKEAPYCPT